MNKKELEAAQFFHGVWWNAERNGDAMDPKRNGANMGHVFTSFSSRASDAFWRLTGRSPKDVSLTELSTVTPAPWARAYKPDLS